MIPHQKACKRPAHAELALRMAFHFPARGIAIATGGLIA
jgi:hypothetical protein